MTDQQTERKDTFRRCADEFVKLQEEIADRIWNQARIVAEVGESHGDQSLSEFAREVGISHTWAYKLQKLYRTFGDKPVAPDLSPTAHIAIAEKFRDQPDLARQWAEAAADGEWSKDRTRAEISAGRIQGENTPPIKTYLPEREEDRKIAATGRTSHVPDPRRTVREEARINSVTGVITRTDPDPPPRHEPEPRATCPLCKEGHVSKSELAEYRAMVRRVGPRVQS